MIILMLLLLVGLPVAWLASEFQERRWLRIAMGISALALSFLVAAAIGSLEHMNANEWYGVASKNLIDATISEMETGDSKRLLRELKVLQSRFVPTYENRARYDHLIMEFASKLDREYDHNPQSKP